MYGLLTQQTSSNSLLWLLVTKYFCVPNILHRGNYPLCPHPISYATGVEQGALCPESVGWLTNEGHRETDNITAPNTAESRLGELFEELVQKVFGHPLPVTLIDENPGKEITKPPEKL